MVKIYLYKIDYNNIKKDLTDYIRRLPDWRIEKAERIIHEESRIQSIVAGRLLDMAVADYLAVDIADVIWPEDYDENSRMYIDKESGKKLLFNITHAGELVAVAVSESCVGLDIECKEDKDFHVTERMFAPEDREYILGDQNRFRDVWTIKESFLKCTGEGIVVPLNSFTVDYEGIFKKPLKVISKGHEMKDDYYVMTERILDGSYSFSVCMQKSNLVLDTKWVEVLV
ncbi:MAG: 4'-phosphopantetheinyl transferase superfamily protein [Eubacterium sp.]|nr:4'-phosphopantetheinyl transferase superfamily protein [Eubacterium sp.]